jgi:hypothetical protein
MSGDGVRICDSSGTSQLGFSETADEHLSGQPDTCGLTVLGRQRGRKRGERRSDAIMKDDYEEENGGDLTAWPHR